MTRRIEDPVEHYAAQLLAELAPEILAVDDSAVIMTARGVDLLPEYSSSLPTGKCDGKVWKCARDRRDASQGWWLAEYVDVGEPGYINITWREILLAEPLGAPCPT